MTPRRALCGFGLVAAWLSVATAAGATVDIVPRPQTIEATQAGFVRLDAGTAILAPRGDASAMRTARWLASLALRSRGLRLVPVTRAGAGRTAIVFQRRPGPAQSEAYSLDVGHGRVVIAASSDAGLLYGAVSLWQLMTSDDGRGPVRLGAVRIADQPRFPWRGLLLDSARHFQSPAFIDQTLDWMALHKLNVLQWHLTDDEGWRLPVEGWPRLTQVGAWRIPASVGPPPRNPKTGASRLYGGFYTRNQIRQIVAHAKARNVTIVPEIEMPGHAVAALLAYPELSAGPPPPRSAESDWGLLPYAYGVDDKVFAFLDSVLGQVIDLFPGHYVAIGGDEVPLDIWKASPAVQARMKSLGIADESALQNYFIRRIDSYLAAHGRRLIGWEEILKGGPLPPGAVVTSWQGAQSALTAARAGHDVVLATAPTLYFDNRQGALASEPPGRGWVVSLRDVYLLDPGAPPLPPPLAAAPATPAAPAVFGDTERSHILGLQGNMWSEHIATEDRMAKMMFPRAAAVAEAGWTAQSGRDWPDFLSRMPAEFARFSRLGLAEDQSVFAVDVKTAPQGEGASVTLASQTGFGQIRYTLDGRPPSAASPAYAGPFDVVLPARLAAASFDGVRRISPVVERQLDRLSIRRRVSQELALCPGTLPLDLEGEAPGGKARPVMLIEVMNACWLWPDADLTGIGGVKVTAGALPFNLQLGSELAHVVHRRASTSGMELQVRLDGCDGELLATLPLGTPKPGLANLSAPLPPRLGRHTLCIAVAGDRIDPMWALNEVQLIPSAGEAS